MEKGQVVDPTTLHLPDVRLDNVPGAVAVLWAAEADPKSLGAWDNNKAVVLQVTGPHIWVISKWGSGKNFSLLRIPVA